MSGIYCDEKGAYFGFLPIAGNGVFEAEPVPGKMDTGVLPPFVLFLSALGFFFSRLLLFSPLGMTNS